MPSPSTIYLQMARWFAAADVEPDHVNTCNSLALLARLVVEGQGVAVLPTELVRAEIASGAIRALTTRPTVNAGIMAVAYSGPVHRYRVLIRMVIKALNESGVMGPL